MEQVRRRHFLARSVALALLAGMDSVAQTRSYRMAYLVGSSDTTTRHLQKMLFDRLDEVGYREGQNLMVERRFADGRVERLPALAAELVALRPDIIFAGSSQAALAASKATNTIPIVFVGVPDPVGLGIVKSLNRPARNATGLSAQSVEIHAKRLQLLKEVFPLAKQITVLHDPVNTPSLPILATLRDASETLGLALRVIETKTEQDFAPAFKLLTTTERPDVLCVIESPITFVHRTRIVEFVNGARLPAVYGFPEFAEVGGLMSYSFNLLEHYRAAATYVNKILKGAKPAELPVEQPTRFELVLNLKTAKALGVKFPPSILLRADRVIE